MADGIRRPGILVGEQLSAITFVMDYVQVHFSGPILTFRVPVYVGRPTTGLPSPVPAGGMRCAL